MRVLHIDRDSDTVRAVKLILRAEKIHSYDTDFGEEGISLAKRYDYDAIILELILPDMTGFEVLRLLRLGKIKTPVLILTQESQAQSKVKALDMGADDYLVKPFHGDELVARIFALVRRSRGSAQRVITIGELALDLEMRQLTVEGVPVHLTEKEYLLVELLFLRSGRIISKSDFLDHLYGGAKEPEERIIDVFISRLRKKLGAHGECIQTRWGAGHVLQDPAQPQDLQVPATNR
ncbi:MAG: response regulator transcription factor [Minisyncoccia bacterium]